MPEGYFTPEDRRRIAEFVSTNHRRLLGKGPFKTSIEIVNDFIIVEAEGILNKTERILATDEINHEVIAELRQRIFCLCLPQWKKNFQDQFGLDLVSLASEPDIKNDRETLKLMVTKL